MDYYEDIMKTISFGPWCPEHVKIKIENCVKINLSDGMDSFSIILDKDTMNKHIRRGTHIEYVQTRFHIGIQSGIEFFIDHETICRSHTIECPVSMEYPVANVVDVPIAEAIEEI